MSKRLDYLQGLQTAIAMKLRDFLKTKNIDFNNSDKVRMFCHDYEISYKHCQKMLTGDFAGTLKDLVSVLAKLEIETIIEFN